MSQTPYRENTPPPLLPLPGASVHVLQRQGSSANVAMMAVWGGTVVLVSVASSVLDGRVPDAVLPAVGVPIVFAGLCAAWFVYKRVGAGSRWRLHATADRCILERVQPPRAFDLAAATLRRARYVYSVRGGRGAMPTVTIELPDETTLVVTGPIGVGWQNVDEEEFSAEVGFGAPALAGSPAPDVRLDDSMGFAALSARATPTA